MKYCFVKEDIEKIKRNDPLFIQMEYAKRLGIVLQCDIYNQKIITVGGIETCEKTSDKVFLRSSYNNMESAIKLLQQNGMDVVETIKDVELIEKWDELKLTHRVIFRLQIEDVLNAKYQQNICAFLKKTEYIFVKSANKSFSAFIPSEKLLRRESEIINFFESERQLGTKEILMSPMLDIMKDSLGIKECRVVVLDGDIINFSRSLHSVKHIVPNKWVNIAQRIVDKINENENFPKNYVLDICEFFEKGERYLDVVEINPITCAICYVNNSIFVEGIEEICEIKRIMRFGNEYCYDYLEHPERYITHRYSNESYEYIGDKRYSFI